MYSDRHTQRTYSSKRRSVPAQVKACVETRIRADQLAALLDPPPASLLYLCDEQDIWRNFIASIMMLPAAFIASESTDDASKELAATTADITLLLSSIVTKLTTEAYEKQQINTTKHKTVRRVTSLQQFTKKSIVRQDSLNISAMRSNN